MISGLIVPSDRNSTVVVPEAISVFITLSERSSTSLPSSTSYVVVLSPFVTFTYLISAPGVRTSLSFSYLTLPSPVKETR